MFFRPWIVISRNWEIIGGWQAPNIFWKSGWSSDAMDLKTVKARLVSPGMPEDSAWALCLECDVERWLKWSCWQKICIPCKCLPAWAEALRGAGEQISTARGGYDSIPWGCFRSCLAISQMDAWLGALRITPVSLFLIFESIKMLTD